MIYFVQGDLAGHIKIGTTVRLSQRLGTLAYECGMVLTILGICDGGREEEKALHRRFERFNVEGEWFLPEPELLAFIQTECREWTSVDDAPLAELVTITAPGTPEWREWLDRLAAHVRGTPSATIDRALAELARKEGFEDPPRRT